MRNCFQACFFDELAGFATDAVCFVLDTYERFLEVIDELDLAAGHLVQLLAFPGTGAIFHAHVFVFSIIGPCFILTGDQALEEYQFFLGGFQFLEDDFLKLLQFLITVAIYRTCGRFGLIEHGFGEFRHVCHRFSGG